MTLYSESDQERLLLTIADSNQQL